jgi:hypothetical protein
MSISDNSRALVKRRATQTVAYLHQCRSWSPQIARKGHLSSDDSGGFCESVNDCLTTRVQTNCAITKHLLTIWKISLLFRSKGVAAGLREPQNRVGIELALKLSH